MIFTETKLKGVFVIEQELFEDERGFFAQSWSAREFEARGLDSRLVESNISFNKRSGTLRGLHYQSAPRAQGKLVRCTMGSIFDVAVDLRPSSPTRKQWAAAELSAGNRRMLYIPEGFAHGYQTLEDDTEVFYQTMDVYSPEHAAGVRWDDPAFGIRWPDAAERIINERDRRYLDYIS